ARSAAGNSRRFSPQQASATRCGSFEKRRFAAFLSSRKAKSWVSCPWAISLLRATANRPWARSAPHRPTRSNRQRSGQSEGDLQARRRGGYLLHGRGVHKGRLRSLGVDPLHLTGGRRWTPFSF